MIAAVVGMCIGLFTVTLVALMVVLISSIFFPSGFGGIHFHSPRNCNYAEEEDEEDDDEEGYFDSDEEWERSRYVDSSSEEVLQEFIEILKVGYPDKF